MRICCPICGERDLREFHYEGSSKLIDRPKQGFGLPIADWLRGPLREWVEGLINETRLLNEGYFHPEPILLAWQRHLNGENMHNQLWGVLMFQAWLENNS